MCTFSAAWISHRVYRYTAGTSSHCMEGYKMLVKCKGRAGGKGQSSAVTFGDLYRLTRSLPTTPDWAYEESTHLHPATAEQQLSISEHKRKQTSLSGLHSIAVFLFSQDEWWIITNAPGITGTANKLTKSHWFRLRRHSQFLGILGAATPIVLRSIGLAFSYFYFVLFMNEWEAKGKPSHRSNNI